MNQDLSVNALTSQFKQLFSTAKRYYGILFFIFVGGIYIFLIMQTNIFVNAQPDESSIKAETAKKLLVNEETAKQLQELRDNSVNVQAIPNDTRANPFEE